MSIKICCDQCGHTWDVEDGAPVPGCSVAVPNDEEAPSRLGISFMELTGRGSPNVTIERFHLCLECAMALLIAFKQKKIDIERKRDWT